MTTIIANDFNNVYVSLLELLNSEGVVSTTRKGAKIYELFDQKFVIRNPLKCLASCRNLSLTYLEKELAFYTSGSNLLKDAIACSNFWEKCSDDDETINSNYGKLIFHDKNERDFSQYQHALNCLKNNPQSKKAVMTLYDKENAFISNDNPCTMFLRARIDSKNLLHLTTYMRSSDIYFGLPYDVPFFVFVQWCLLKDLQKTYPGITFGTYTHVASSLHKYEYKDLELKEARERGKVQIDEGYHPASVTYLEGLFSKFYWELQDKLGLIKKNKFMQLAWEVSKKSKCLKKQVGACLSFIDRDGEEDALTSGYGGVKGPDCLTCIRDLPEGRDEYFGDECPSVHSEMWCISKAYKMGFKSFKESTMYATHGPCDACLKLCNLVGIKKVVYDKPYKTDYSHWPEIEVVQVNEL